MRILHVVPTYYPAVRYGGPIRSVHGLAAAQVSMGHTVSVFTTNVDGSGVSNVLLECPVYLDGVAVYYFPVPALRRLYWSPSMGAALRKEIKHFDVVHLHSVYLWPTYAAARAASAARVPYLVAPRGMLVRQLINAKNRWIKEAWIRLVEHRTLQHAAGLHVTTDAEERDVRDLALPIPAVYCVPNGVDIPSSVIPFKRCPFDAVRLPYVLYVGRLNWKKGLHQLIEAWTNVPNELQLVLAGNDEDGYRAKLEQLARSLGVFERVRFLGEVSDEHKWALYKHATIFVLASTSENFGNVVLEAMAMACPVLISSGVGLADLVRRVRCGVVCNNQPHELAEAIVKLYLDRHSSQLMGERGQKAVRESLSWQSVAMQMNMAYEQVLSSDGLRLAGSHI